MTDRKLRSYPDKYDWVKVRSNRKHNLGKREWNQQTNVPIKEGEELILPRGSSDPDEDLTGMKFYFKNGFYEVIDAEPFGNDLQQESDAESSAPEEDDDEKEIFQCEDCGFESDSSQGLQAHRRQKHKKEETEE